MKNEYIKWNRKTSLELRKAINNFNKRISNTLKDDTFFPEPKSYQEVKANILTKKEFQNVMRQLNNFQKENATDTVTFKYKQKDEVKEISATKWEVKELKKARNRQLTRLKKDLEPYLKKNKQGYTLLQMGNKTAIELKEKIEVLKGMSTVNLLMKKDSIMLQGRIDYKVKQAKTWQENYLNQMKQFEKQKGYKNLKKEMNQYKNDPLGFFERFGGHEMWGDINIFSDNLVTNDMFQSMLVDLEIL